MADTIRALVLGDVVGHSGVRALLASMPGLKREYRPDLIVVNAENAAGGFGLTPEIADELLSSGVSVITTGNHIWQRREILPYMESEPRVLRPANYPGSPKGCGYVVVETPVARVAVVNLQGRVRLAQVDCPFRTAQQILQGDVKDADAVIIDFHAEEVEEKEALATYLDGSVSLVVGTHTHVQTGDERILERGTGYITDLGMTGPEHSVIGFAPEPAIERMTNQMPIKMEVSDEPSAVRGVTADISRETGVCLRIERIDTTPSQ